MKTLLQKIRQNSYFTILLLLFIIIVLAPVGFYLDAKWIQYAAKPKETAKVEYKDNPDKCTQTTIVSWDDILAILNETNNQRRIHNLSEVQMSADLTRLTFHKAAIFWEQEEKWTGSGWPEPNPHNINGREWTDIYNDCHTQFVGHETGENISRKSLPINRVVDCPPERCPGNPAQQGGWMQSETGHRENMLNPKWKYVGIYSGHKGDGRTFPSTYHIQLFSE